MIMSKIIGIDLGTTFSAVSVMEGGNPTIIPNSEGERTTASVVAINEDGDRLIGNPARNQAILNPEHTVRSIKRHMGEDYKVKLRGKEYTPQQISAMILQKLKKDAEDYLGTKVKKAVITVPAYFTDSQRQATKDAGKIAGLEVERIINEPTAASLAYGLDKAQEQKILVFDFGGGTFDVSILELGDGVFEVLASDGDNHLGGDDIDEIIVDYLSKKFKDKHGIDLRQDKQSYQRVREAAEKAKIELSSKQKTSINLPFVTSGKEGPLHLNEELTRAKFENLIKDILKKLKTPTKQALKDANLSASDLNKVIFVGGSTRIPAVQELVKDLTGKAGDKSVNPDEAVSLGAAIQGGILAGDVKDVLLLDVTPLTLGIETLGGVMTPIIEKNTTIPTSKSKIFSTAENNQSAVTIHVLQGERPMAADNKSLGKFDLVGIPPAPKGTPQIEVTFDIDANGIVNVSAEDKGTGKKQNVEIKATTNLSDEEIEKMKKEAEEHAEEDKKKKERVETLNKAESTVYSAEQLLEEQEEHVDEDKKKTIQDKVQALKTAKEADEPDIDDVKKKMDELNKTLQEIGKEIYQKAAQAQQAKQQGKQEGKEQEKKDEEEDVVDADYEDVEEKKKD